MINRQRNEYGAVSLFIVVFAALLITVVTVSFIRIMVREQQQATAVDLSQSAYDSAQAGVEDAKRAILRYKTICASGDSRSQDCIDAKTIIGSSECNKSLENIVTITDSEVKVQQTSGTQSIDLDQAYTCVKIVLDTDNYVGRLDQDSTKLIPLFGVSDFDSIRIDWFSANDLQNGAIDVDVPSFSSGTPLLLQENWVSSLTPNRPPVMRAQLIQFGSSGFVLSDFDGGKNDPNTSNTSTLFLYPSSIVASINSFSDDVRMTPPSSPVPVHCNSTLGAGGYSCSTTIVLPNPIDGGGRTAYLNLNSLYKGSSYQVTLLSGSSVVKFNAVQPIVDSTGRANDLFRRVESRIETASGAYPEAGVSVTGSFCKNFSVTDNPTDYSANSCSP